MARFKQPQLSRLQIMPIKTYFPTFSKKKTPSDKFFFFYSSHPTVVPWIVVDNQSVISSVKPN